MPLRLPPHFVDLVYNALLNSFWHKKSLRNFLRRAGIPPSVLADFHDSEMKRDWLDRLFPKLEEDDQGQAIIEQIAVSLAEQKTFPDLARLEDSAERTRQAAESVKALNDYLRAKQEKRRAEDDHHRQRELAEEARTKTVRSINDLDALKTRLDSLCFLVGTQEGGYAFQDWFYDLISYAEVEHRRPYTDHGRQIDGSITIDGTTYLVELKFTGNHADATDIDSLLAKVGSKADNTMAVMISISGYSAVALQQSSFAKTPLLLLDHGHLYMVLQGAGLFPEVIRRIRRNASQTGNAYLPIAEFGGRV